MTASPHAPRAAEFPNDNPELHDGVRWLCLEPVGAVRAVSRPPSGTVADALVPPPARRPRPPEPPPIEQRYKGPLELDLGRILLVHRVEDVPPPPEFIFRPFVSSRRPEPPPGAVAAATPIDPRPCRVVDERHAERRVERGWRVDVAPCLSILAAGVGARGWRSSGAARPALPSELSRERDAVTA